MSVSIHDLTVPTFRQFLDALGVLLEKAETHGAESGMTDADILGARLCEDMQPFSFQVAQAINHSAGAVIRLTGDVYHKPETLETLADCKAAVAGAIATLEAMTPEALNGPADKTVVYKTPTRVLNFKDSDFLLSFAFPNFFFHLTTAYDILRQIGAPIGKRDFLGEVKMTLG